MKKKRADELLYEHGHCESTADAALLILEGRVRSKPDALVHKASEMFPADTVLLVDSGTGFVSRGALKLQQALEKFAPDLHGRAVADPYAAVLPEPLAPGARAERRHARKHRRQYHSE